jgi:hypothetical protein
MQIIIDTSNLSELDINMLAFLAGQGEEDAPEADEEPEAKPKKAKKADPEPEPEENDEAPTMSDAVAVATQLVSSGEAAKVKAALAEVGAKRVSEMKEEDIPSFLAALEA